MGRDLCFLIPIDCILFEKMEDVLISNFSVFESSENLVQKCNETTVYHRSKCSPRVVRCALCNADNCEQYPPF